MKKDNFDGVVFRGTFRDYQQKVLDETGKYLVDGKIHIVAAPGSGKTVLGLEIIRRLGGPALVLSPTIVVADQWGDRFTELFLPEGDEEDDYISEDLKKPELITSITYQALYSAWNRLETTETAGGDLATDDDLVTDDALDSDADSGNVSDADSGNVSDADSCTDSDTDSDEVRQYAFPDFDPVACIREAGVTTICLDEAHHLKHEWQKALEAFLAAVSKDINIVALTATPPYDSSESDWRRYVSLCGEIDTEIFVPELVAQKTLCPHQDYILFNYPVSAENEIILSHRQDIANCVDEVLRSGLLASAAVQCGLVGVFLPPPYQLYDNAQDYLSFAVCANSVGIPPSEALVKKLLLGKPLPAFNIEHLQRTFAFIAENHEVFGDELTEQMAAVCRRHRLAPHGKLLLTDTSRTGKALFSSLGKLESIREIACEEYRNLGGKLRMVVLTDNIRKDFLSVIGTEERIDAIGAIPIFETLRRALPPLARIGMLSGALVIWPLDRIDMIEEIAARHHTCFTFKEIVQKGVPGITLPALPNGDSDTDAGIPRYAVLNFAGNRRTMIAVLTEAFQSGAVEVIVGTKALLGEGWDSPCINSLILASFVGSYVMSNQMRGRAIRTDRNDPDKTANIWHLVAIEPDFLTEKGIIQPLHNLFTSRDELLSADYELLKRRFKMFFAPDYGGGMISNGIDRIKIVCPPFDKEGIERINNEMKRLAADREGMARSWTDILGAGPAPRITDASFIPKASIPRPRRNVAVKNSFGLAGGAIVFIVCLNIANMGLLSVASGSGLVIFLAFVSVILLSWFGAHVVRLLRQALSNDYVLRILAESLCATMKTHGVINSKGARVSLSNSKDYATIICGLEGASAREQNIFGNAVKEMLSPMDDPRYVIVHKRMFSSGLDPGLSFAAPSSFKNIALAKDLAARLSKHFDKCVAVYTRTESGYRLLNECRVKSFAGLCVVGPLRKLIVETGKQ